MRDANIQGIFYRFQEILLKVTFSMLPRGFKLRGFYA